MPKMPNLRTLTVSTGDGKCVEDTQMIKGEAKKSSTWSAKNETKQYNTSGLPGKDNAGGLNTNS